jgi:hypothetical protein
MANRGKRGTTISELRWPIEKPEFGEISNEWPTELITQVIGFVWCGYDLIKEDIFSRIDCSKANKQIEKNINSLLQVRINRAMTGDEPFDVQHEVPEFETSYSDQAQPPSYDIAFILRANERIIFPLEAKVLRTERYLSQYINEINANFLTCRYAPFSSEAGMLGYLLKGESQKAFEKIEQSLSCVLLNHPDFSDREHRISNHQRTVPVNKNYPDNFCCHHLLLKIINNKLPITDKLKNPENEINKNKLLKKIKDDVD